MDNVKTVFENVSKATNDQEKVDALRNGVFPIKDLLRYVYDSAPSELTVPEYNKRDPSDTEGNISFETVVQDFRYLLNKKIPADSREVLLKKFLEGLTADGADLLTAIITKNIPNLSKEVVNQAFPGLIP